MRPGTSLDKEHGSPACGDEYGDGGDSQQEHQQHSTARTQSLHCNPIRHLVFFTLIPEQV
jgi:hypothetical protein